jgi:hypothetical protein
MEQQEKMKILKAFREFVPYLIIVTGLTYVKYRMYKAKPKRISRERLFFVTTSSFIFGMIGGLACWMIKPHIMLSFAVVSACTMASESIVEVFVVNSKSTFLLIWDRAVGVLLSWIDSFKKEKKK